MKRYWQFLIIGAICLLVALLWAQPRRASSRPPANGATTAAVPQAATARSTSKPATTKSTGASNDDQEPLPGSSSSLPLLAVIGFGVLAGGITSAMRTR